MPRDHDFYTDTGITMITVAVSKSSHDHLHKLLEQRENYIERRDHWLMENRPEHAQPWNDALRRVECSIADLVKTMYAPEV